MSPPEKSSQNHHPVKKHPFFMAPAERAAQRLSQQISASNELNRAIQINLLSEDETSETIETVAVDGTSISNSFFKKRTKLSSFSNGFNGRNVCKLKRISSTDPPPFPLEFQLIFPIKNDSSDYAHVPFGSINKMESLSSPILLKVPEITKNDKIKVVSFAKLLRTRYFDMNSEDLKKLNFITNFRSLKDAKLFDDRTHKRNLMRLILNEIELASNDNTPTLWIISGPPGSGKTRLVEDLSEKLAMRLITIDSSQSPRNSKTFETLQTTLTHSAVATAKESTNVAILFDEVEIAFENDRGYWTALSSFLHNIPSKTSSKFTKSPIFITSNAPRSFLESIIKFPEYAQFIQFDGYPDFREFNNNCDIINRLHRIDTSIEYEQFVLKTGYHDNNISDNNISDIHYNSEIGNNSDIDNNSCPDFVINEALKWNGLIESIHKYPKGLQKDQNVNYGAFAYLESASLADVLLSIKDRSDTLKLRDSSDFIDNQSLLFTSLPEIYDNTTTNTAIARELIERTIFHSFGTNSTNLKQPDWTVKSKKLLKRFHEYTRSLQNLQTWQSELTDHVIRIEKEYFAASNSRRKRAYYRYLGDELFNEILNFEE